MALSVSLQTCGVHHLFESGRMQITAEERQRYQQDMAAMLVPSVRDHAIDHLQSLNVPHPPSLISALFSAITRQKEPPPAYPEGNEAAKGIVQALCSTLHGILRRSDIDLTQLGRALNESPFSPLLASSWNVSVMVLAIHPQDVRAIFDAYYGLQAVPDSAYTAKMEELRGQMATVYQRVIEWIQSTGKNSQ
jgi:hypothetical protein